MSPGNITKRAAVATRNQLMCNLSTIYAPRIEGGGCLFRTTGTALSEAALSEFHNRLQKPSSRGAAQNDRPTLPSSLSPCHSKILPKKMKPAVVYVAFVVDSKPAASKAPVLVSMYSRGVVQLLASDVSLGVALRVVAVSSILTVRCQQGLGVQEILQYAHVKLAAVETPSG